MWSSASGSGRRGRRCGRTVDPAPAAVEGLHGPLEARAGRATWTRTLRRRRRPGPERSRSGGRRRRPRPSRRSRSRLSRPAKPVDAVDGRAARPSTRSPSPRGCGAGGGRLRPRSTGAEARPWWPAGARTAPQRTPVRWSQAGPVDGCARDPGQVEGDLHRGEEGVDPGEHGDVGGRRPPRARRSWTTATVAATVASSTAHDEIGVGAGAGRARRRWSWPPGAGCGTAGCERAATTPGGQR